MSPPAAPARLRWRLAAVLYAACGVAIWWHAWSQGPASTLPKGSVDPLQSVWFLGWALHAAAHGLNPFFTTAMYAPPGVNLLDNTSTLALGAALSPITALFGPVASFNVAVVLAPAASALAAYFAAGRYVSYRPAAFVAGLCYGFGPFLGTDLQLGHLNLTFSAVPPLVLLCLDELLVSQRRGPRPVGLCLGILIVLQFFISTEVLAIEAVVAVLGLGVLALSHHGDWRRRVQRAAPGLAVAGFVAVAALAYPAWFAILGPRHVVGPVFRSTTATTATLWSTLSPGTARRGVRFISGGNGAYLGVPLVAVLGLGTVLWRRARGFLFFVAMAAVCLVLSLGPSLHVTGADTHIPLPAAVLGHLPLLWSIMPSRFGILVDLFAAVSFGIALDRLRAGDLGGRPAGAGPATSSLGPVLSLVAAVAVLATIAAALPWPYAVRPVAAPAILGAPGFRALPPGSVVSSFPSDADHQGGLLLGQASGGDRFALTTGYAIVPGRSGRATEQVAPNPLQLLYAAGALGRLAPTASPAEAQGVEDTITRLHIAAVLVDTEARGAPVVADVLEQILGPPDLHAGAGIGWLLPAG